MRRKGTDRRVLQQAITMEERRVAFRRDPENFRRQDFERRIEDLGNNPERRVAQRRAEDIEKLQKDNAEIINLPLMP